MFQRVLLLTIFVSIGALWNTASFAQQPMGNIQCGDIVEGEVVAGQSSMVTTVSNYAITVDEYVIDAPAGTRIDLTVTPLGTSFNVAIVLIDSGGSDVLRLNAVTASEAEQLIEFPLASSNQVIRILGVRPEATWDGDNNGAAFYATATMSSRNNAAGSYFGAYEIRLTCQLRDGTFIEAGSTDMIGAQPESVSVLPTFSGFGFPGLAPVDFSAGIEIPLTLAQSQTIPLASDVALYTYAASAGEVRTLSLSRLSGDISIGVAVTNRDTNAIIFMGGLPSSDKLSVELTFPSDAIYAIGLFRLNTAERSGTSGAVQVMLE